eukprot:1151724-Pelagomonas_calceolata.AAC.2
MITVAVEAHGSNAVHGRHSSSEQCTLSAPRTATCFSSWSANTVSCHAGTPNPSCQSPGLPHVPSPLVFNTPLPLSFSPLCPNAGHTTHMLTHR